MLLDDDLSFAFVFRFRIVHHLLGCIVSTGVNRPVLINAGLRPKRLGHHFALIEILHADLFRIPLRLGNFNPIEYSTLGARYPVMSLSRRVG